MFTYDMRTYTLAAGCFLILAMTQASELQPAESLALVQAAHDDAQAKVTALLTQGSDENACQELAESTKNEIVANVAAQQKQLDDMPKGTTDCDDAADHVTNEAQARLTEALGKQKEAAESLAKLRESDINFGEFKLSELDEGQCSTFFDQKVYKDTRDAVITAEALVKTTNDAVESEQLAFAKDEEEAGKIVKACRCDALTLLRQTFKTFKKDSLEANTKTWTESAHMICVLDGTGADSCTVPALPVVVQTEISDTVQASCSSFSAVFSKNLFHGAPTGEYEFELIADICPDDKCPDNFGYGMEDACFKFGMLPVCEHEVYCKNEAQSWFIGQKSEISYGANIGYHVKTFFPDGFEAIVSKFYGTCVFKQGWGYVAACNNKENGDGNFDETNGVNKRGRAYPYFAQSWMKPSQTRGNGWDGKPNHSRSFVCAKKKHRSYTVKLDSQHYEFRIVTSMHKGKGPIQDNMVKDCEAIGMKPVCDDPGYCRHDPRSIYIGNQKSFTHWPFVTDISKNPTGWANFIEDYSTEIRGVCAFTGNSGNKDSYGKPLTKCMETTTAGASNWFNSAEKHEFMCAKVV